MLVFPLQSNPIGSETAQCSPRACRGVLSEELGTACSDQRTKLSFKLPRSSLLATKPIKLVLPTLQLYSRLGAKGASGTGANPFHGRKTVPAAPPANQPHNSSLWILADPRGSKFPSKTFCMRCSSLSCMLGKWFGSLPSHLSFFKKMEPACSSQNRQCLWFWL